MHRQNQLAFLSIKQIEFDSICIIAAYFLSYFMVRHITFISGIEVYIWLLFTFLPLWVLIMFVLRMYHETTFLYTDRVINSIILATGLSGILISALVYAVKESMFNMLFYCIFIVTSTFFVIIQRFSYIYYLKKKHTNNRNNVLVIGQKDLYERFKYFENKMLVKFNVIGFIPINQECTINQETCLFNDEILYDFLRENIVDEIILILPRDNVCKIEKYIYLFEEMGVTVRMLLDLYDLKVAKVHVSAIGTMPMVTFHTVSLNQAQLSLKRCMDIFGALIGLLLTAIFGVLIALAIRLESKGPVIFSQKRVGARGRVFNCYKFRSMYVDAEDRLKEIDSQNQIAGGFMFKVKDDPRITRVGKFLRKTSLDEFPQFLNVLKGDMSLVGTRPPTLNEVEKYKNSQKRRISIKPGITGMWQINGRSNIHDFDEVVRLDTSYIDNWSIWLDVKILFKTIFIVFQRTGAF